MEKDNEGFELIGKYDRLSPETEDLLFDGTELRNGMKVTFADPSWRKDLDQDPSEGMLHMILQRNRWFTVTHVVARPNYLAYIAEYEDGHKERHEWEAHPSFWVKKDTVPAFGEGVHNQIQVEGVVTIKLHEDGTASVFIIEESGTVTEFRVKRVDFPSTVQKAKTFADLVSEDLPPVDPKAPFLGKKDMIKKVQGGKFDSELLEKQLNVERHDPEWAIQNLQRTPKFIAPDPTEGAQDSAGDEIDTEHETIVIPPPMEVRPEDPDATKIIPVYEEPSSFGFKTDPRAYDPEIDEPRPSWETE